MKFFKFFFLIKKINPAENKYKDDMYEVRKILSNLKLFC